MEIPTNTRHEVNILPQLEKACGLDIHKDKIVAFISEKSGNNQELKEFGTYTKDLFCIRDWLLAHNTRHCLMESTGIYWISLYHTLSQAGISVTVANPLHIKQIPKRKTDRKDARWLCTLLLNGLVRASFIPDLTQSQLRDLCRNRLFYSQQQTRLFNRLIKILEMNNIKLRSVISSIHTKTGMEIIRLLAAGETDMDKLLACVKGRAKTKIDLMKLALVGTLNEHHRSLMQMLLNDIEHLQGQTFKLELRIKSIMKQYYAKEQECLDNITGIAEQSAQIIISEIGINMERFPTADHLSAWCGVAPGNHESAGKRKNVSTKKGNNYLRVALVAIAWAAVRTKDSYWRALYYHLRKRMKGQKAIIAIARRMLKVIYKVIRDKSLYTEKGLTHFMNLQIQKRHTPNAVTL